MSVAFIGQKFLSFIYFTIVARMIGADKLGIYTFATSFTGIFSILVDLGLTPFLIRSIARDQKSAFKLLKSVFGIKLVLGILALALVGISIVNAEQDILIREVVILSGILMALDSLVLSLWGIFRGLRNLFYESVSVVAAQLITLIIGLAGLWMGMSIHILIIALIAGSLFQLVYAYALARQYTGAAILPEFTLPSAKSIMSSALPFGLLGIFSKLYASIDSVLLKFLGGPLGMSYVGWYSVPFKINFALQVLPSAFSAVMFPTMSHYLGAQNKTALKYLFEKSLFFLMMAGVPASLGLIVLAPEIILKIYGPEFKQSIPALQILSVGLVFIFLSFPVGALLNASYLQPKNTMVLGLALLLNVALNFLLIPRLYHVGASIAAVSSHIFLFFGGLYYCGRLVDYSKKNLTTQFLKILSAAFIMAGVVLYGKTAASFYFPEPVLSLIQLIVLPIFGALAYFLSLYALRGIALEDWRPLFKRGA
ncbi:MAG: flippase [Parcubacteria group bacterium]|nr:flippase [Parcubacteria group bacterium]